MVKSIFVRHGKPDILYSDNGPQFVNNAFQSFLEEWQITQKTSSPKYPQSNGFIERHVQTVKKVLKKALYDKRDMYLTLLEYRNTPISKSCPSPAQLLFGRRLKGYLLLKEEMLNPYNKLRSRNNENYQRNQKFYYNKNARDLPELVANDNVMVQGDNKEWKPGRVIKKDTNRPRSYIVRLNENGKMYIRNRRFLRKKNMDRFDKRQEFDQMYERLIESNREEKVTNNSHCNPEAENNGSADSSAGVTNEDRNQGHIVQSKLPNANNTGTSERALVVTRSGRTVNKPKYLKDFV